MDDLDDFFSTKDKKKAKSKEKKSKEEKAEKERLRREREMQADAETLSDLGVITDTFKDSSKLEVKLTTGKRSAIDLSKLVDAENKDDDRPAWVKQQEAERKRKEEEKANAPPVEEKPQEKTQEKPQIWKLGMGSTLKKPVAPKVVPAEEWVSIDKAEEEIEKDKQAKRAAQRQQVEKAREQERLEANTYKPGQGAQKAPPKNLPQLSREKEEEEEREKAERIKAKLAALGTPSAEPTTAAEDSNKYKPVSAAWRAGSGGGVKSGETSGKYEPVGRRVGSDTSSKFDNLRRPSAPEAKSESEPKPLQPADDATKNARLQEKLAALEARAKAEEEAKQQEATPEPAKKAYSPPSANDEEKNARLQEKLAALEARAKAEEEAKQQGAAPEQAVKKAYSPPGRSGATPPATTAGATAPAPTATTTTSQPWRPRSQQAATMS